MPPKSNIRRENKGKEVWRTSAGKGKGAWSVWTQVATRSEGAVPGQTSAGPFRAPNPSPRQFHPPGPAARRRPTSSLRLTTFRDTPTRLTWRLRPGPRHAEESRARRGGAGRGAGAGRVEGRASPGFQDRATEEALAAGRRGRGAAERAAPQGPDEAGSRPYPLLTPRWRPVLPRSPPGPSSSAEAGLREPGLAWVWRERGGAHPGFPAACTQSPRAVLPPAPGP